MVTTVTAEEVQADPVNVQFFVMSKCPYAAGLVQQFNKNVYSATGLPGIMNITFNFIAQVCPTQPLGFCSKHGDDEVRGDWIELCANQLNHAQLFSLVACLDQSYSSIPNNVAACTSQLKISLPPIQTCVTNNGAALLTQSIKVTNALGITTSPNLFVDGTCLYGGLGSCTNVDPTSDAIKKAICAAYKGTKPAGCSSNVIDSSF